MTSSDDQAAGSAPEGASLLSVLCFLVLAASAVAGCTGIRRFLRKRHRRLGANLNLPSPDGRSRLEEVVAGWQAGALFGLSAVAARAGFLLAGVSGGGGERGRERGGGPPPPPLTTGLPGGHVLYALLGLCGSIGLTSTGLIFQTKALKDGNSVVVCTSAGVATILTAFSFGLFLLGEGLPTSAVMRGLHLFSFLTILLGVVSLSLGSTGAGSTSQGPICKAQPPSTSSMAKQQQ